MTMSKVSRRSHHAELGAKARGVEKRATCDSNTLYTYPTKDTVFDVSSGDITFTWDTTCMSSTLVDLTLQAPELDTPFLNKFAGVKYADGSYTTALQKTWFNGTTSLELQLTMADGDNSLLSFVYQTVAGPIFEATYAEGKTETASVAAAAAATSASAPIVVQVNKEKTDGLAAGSIFAAVFFPVAAVVAVGVAYILWVRRKQAKKSKRWSSAVDQRMSRISTEWRQSTAGSLQPDMRQSTDRRATVMSFNSNTPNFAGRGIYREDESPSSPVGAGNYFTGGSDGYTDRPPRISLAESHNGSSLRVSFSEHARPTSMHLPSSGSRSSLGNGAPTLTVGSRKSYQAPAGSRLSLGQVGGGEAVKGRWSVAGPVALNLDMRAPDHGPWALGEEEELEILDQKDVASPVRPTLMTRRTEGASPLSPSLPQTARLVSPISSPIVGHFPPPSPDLGQASESWFGIMKPSTSSNSLSPDEKLQRHADQQLAKK